jgi:mannose-6-phosphate isomerase-like protein (cupin superfamily)
MPTTGGLLVVAPGGGTPLPGASLIGRAEWFGGAVCVLEQTVAPRILVAAHRHDVETQGAYVVSGTLGFYVDGEETVADAGSYVVRPAGSVHALWNPTDASAQMIEITSPAGKWQELALALQAFHERSAGGPEELSELISRYGTTLQPDVTRKLADRHGVATGAGYSAD